MKIAILMAGAVVAGSMFIASPAPAKVAGQTPVAKTGDVKDELKDLKSAVEAFRKARKSGDRPAEKAAIQNILSIWRQLPPRVKEHVRKKHPELAKIIERLEHAEHNPKSAKSVA